MKEEKGKNKPKINGLFIKILVIIIGLLACIGICFFVYYQSGSFLEDNVEKELWQKYTFKRMPDFIVPRSGGATATVLKDGRVLFTGGIFSPLNSTNSAEIYDPVKKVFIKLPNMNESRTLHSAVLLSNGDVLISGGEKHERGKGFDFLKSAEIYKTKENKFVKINDMQEVMSSHKMYMLQNNDIVALENPNEIQIFDIKTNLFKKMPSVQYIPKGPSYEFLELNKNEILMYPHKYEEGKTPIVVFNTKDLSLKKLDISLTTKKFEAYNIAKISDSELLVSGGTNSDTGDINGLRVAIRVNINTKNQVPVPGLFPEGRYGFATATLENGNVLIFGGMSGITFSLKELGDTVLYINSKDKLLKFKNMKYKRGRCNSNFVKLQNGNYIIWGGTNTFGKPYPPEMLVVKNK